MTNTRINFYVALIVSIMMIISGCGDSNPAITENIKILENNVKTLEESGKITTFPLTIVIGDKLYGDLLPENIQQLCAVSKYSCKTLPIAGLLRLGTNNYYEYNCISALNIPDNIKDSEASVTDSVETQVNRFLTTTKLENYDSLLRSNHPDWDMQGLSYEYIGNSSDSIFFLSESATTPGPIRVGDKTVLVYNNVMELRRKIDEIICKGQKSISVFYTPPAIDTTTGALPRSSYPAKGVPAGDTCVGYAKYEKIHNGSGGYATGNIIELQSVSCGFKYPTGLAGDTCVKGSRFQKMHNGKGGFTVGNLIERNSRSCGFVTPAGPAGDTCVSGSRYQRMHDGKGGFTVGTLKEKNSRSCGFTYPTGVASGDTCVNGSRFQRLHNGRGGFAVGNLLERNSKSCGVKYPTGQASDTCIGTSRYQRFHNGSGGFRLGALKERNSVSCGFTYPAAGTAAEGYLCENGSRYAKLHNGKGGFTRGRLLEANSKQCALTAPAPKTAPATRPATTTTRPPVAEPEEPSANRSDAVCEKDNAGNYTGRRVQYYYNKSGKIVRTVVISKCDSDCRCLGN